MSTPIDFTPVDSADRRVTRRAVRARWRTVWAMLASTGLHAGGGAVVVGVVLWSAFAGGGVENEPDVVVTEIAEPDDVPAFESLVVEPPEEPAADVLESPTSPSLDDVLLLPSLPEPDESFDWQGFARARFDRAVRASDGLTDAEREARLDHLEWMLGRVSNERNVGEMAGSLSKWLGANQRKPVADVDPSKPIENDPRFDAKTAQVLEVLVEQTDSGGTAYVLVMADAAGRLQRVPTDEATGRKMKRILDRIQGNPLLETLYRDVVMGLIDKIVAE